MHGHSFIWKCKTLAAPIDNELIAWVFLLLIDSASIATSEPNIKEEEANVPTASSQSKTMSCSKIVKHKTRLKCNGVVSH